jgi:hypothetical protein
MPLKSSNSVFTPTEMNREEALFAQNGQEVPAFA